MNQSKLQLIACSRREVQKKRVWASHDWFWCYFWLDESCSAESAKPTIFRHSNQNRTKWRSQVLSMAQHCKGYISNKPPALQFLKIYSHVHWYMVWTQEYWFYQWFVFTIVWSSGWLRVVLKRTVVGDCLFDSLSEIIFRVKWVVFVSRWCYKFRTLKAISQLSHDGIGWKTRV